MSLKRILFGPDWRSKDPQRRAHAVAHSADPQLEPELPRIAREDPDERVRLAALKRLDDPRRYLEAARSDPSPALRQEAHALAMRQLAGERACPLSDAQLALLAGEILDEGESEALIRRARSAAVRRALLPRIRRLAVLVELAAADPDPELRQAALGRVDDPAALARIARRARGKDKRVERLAEERLAAARSEPLGGTHAAIEELCRRAEAALRAPPGDPRALVAELRAACTMLALPENDPRLRRVHNALAVLEGFAERRAVTAPSSPPVTATAPPPVRDAPAHEPSPAVCAEAAVAGSEAVAEPATRAEAVAASVPATPEIFSAPSRPEPRGLLQELAAALEEGALLRAERAATALRDLALRERERGRFKELSQKLAELRRWKAWTLREHRDRLLEELAALPPSGLHPDALAARVRELRLQWQDLHREMPAPPALEGRFHALARAALEPARAFFRRRDELRARRRQEIEAVLAAAEATLQPSAPAPEPPGRRTAGALTAMRRRLAALGRELPDLPAADRARLGERLRRALAMLDERRALLAEQVRLAKQALLERLERAAGQPPERASRELERIEAEWRKLGRAQPDAGVALRERLHSLAGRIREAQREQERRRQSAEAERRAQVEALLRRIEALGEAPALPELERLAEAARALRPLPPELFEALGTALEAARRRARAALRERTSAELLALLTPLSGGAPTNPPALEVARRSCVALEELAGLESPPEDAELRLRVQMERLAARLGGGEEDALSRARAALDDWRRVASGLGDPRPFALRLERAIAALAARLYPDPSPRTAPAAGARE